MSGDWFWVLKGRGLKKKRGELKAEKKREEKEVVNGEERKSLKQ